MPYSNIDSPKKYFDTALYTGTTATQSITSLNFKPDLVWLKSRGEAQDHYLFDINRTATKALSSNLTLAEQTYSDSLTSFDSNGFTLGASTRVNKNTFAHVGWSWLASNTTASNTSGTITSTVSANTTSGFSIVSYTGAGGASTVGHGLGVAPRVVIVKSRSNSTNWILGHSSLGWTKYISLNLTDAVETNNYFNDTAPTSSVFSIFNSTNVNGSGYTYVAYCFSEVKGYSKFGSYTGNGSTDGTFVYTGFKPAFIIIKRNEAGYDWHMHDNKRDTSNVVKNRMSPNDVYAESTNIDLMDFTSNGFKLRTTTASWNGSGATWIYMCFAENPFVSSKSIPTTAR
jgi:hypothetical protein